MTRSTAFFALVTVSVLSACTADAPVQPAASAQQNGTVASVISDGGHGGNAQFFFLPPMVASANHTGTFDAGRTPEFAALAEDISGHSAQ